MTFQIYRMLYQSIILLLLGCCLSSSAGRNLQLQLKEVEDIIQDTSQDGSGNVDMIVNVKDCSEESSESHESVKDDLIFLALKNQPKITESHDHHHHHHSVKESESEEEEKSKEEDDDVEEMEKRKEEVHEEETQEEDKEDKDEEVQLPTVTPIDLSPFVALIPKEKVDMIVDNYYRNDADVQRAYAFLSSSHFRKLKQELMQLKEEQEFARYLNANGLDALKLMDSLIQAIRPRTEKLENVDAEETLWKPHLKGLHGMVDSILNVLPQDLILATFFDKIETDKQFGKLVNSIGTPQFAKILHNLQNSEPLQNLLSILQPNGVHIGEIVESLKSYFFLTSF